MEGSEPRRNGGAASQLQPTATCKNLGCMLLDPSVFQKKLEIQELLDIIENNSVGQLYLWAECWFVPYFLEGDTH